MSKEKIKWGIIQPLTGGMYLGAEKAIGHPAEWVISYPGLTDYVKDKNGNVIDAANERNIFNYLKDKNRLPAWYYMNMHYLNNDEMLQDTEYHPEYTLHEEQVGQYSEQPNLFGVDLVCAVPVCAGLSMASTANEERKCQCNEQMIWMTNYALKTIKPKIYLFENAPTLMSSRGDEVRDQLETVAMENGYSIVYYKTDTKYHNNCQKRPRTFIFFFRYRNGEKFIPEMQYEHVTATVEEFFGRLGSEDSPLQINDPMNVTMDNYTNVDVLLHYLVVRFGANWREWMHGDLCDFLATNMEERAKFLEWLSENEDSKQYDWYVKHFEHCDAKAAEGKGWWSTAAKYFNNDCIPACMYKNVPVVVHHKEDRLYTMREWFYTMGHPTDMNMVGNPVHYFRKMGQNVPANTARWVAEEAARIIENWDTLESDDRGQNVAFFDNTKQKRIW